MSSYWVGVLLLLLSSSGFVLWALIRKVPDDQPLQGDVVKDNASVLERQQEELTQELQSGVLTKEEYTARETELKRAFLADVQHTKQQEIHQNKGDHPRKGGYLLLFTAFCLPLAGWFAYQILGAKPALEQRYQQDYTQSLIAQTQSATALITVLENDLQFNHDNAFAWFVLGNAYIETGLLEQGFDAYEQGAKLATDNPRLHSRILGQYAQVMFSTDGEFSARVKETLQQALSINADDPTTLGLLGIEAYENQSFKAAIQYWQRALINSHTDASQQLLMTGIESAQQQLDKQTNIASSYINLTVNIRLAKGLQMPTDSRATLFVYARAKGEKIPLLAAKLKMDKLPQEVVLNDSMAMREGIDFTQYKTLELVAHIATAGVPGQKPGDLIGIINEVSVAKREVIDLLIDQIITK